MEFAQNFLYDAGSGQFLMTCSLTKKILLISCLADENVHVTPVCGSKCKNSFNAEKAASPMRRPIPVQPNAENLMKHFLGTLRRASC